MHFQRWFAETNEMVISNMEMKYNDLVKGKQLVSEQYLMCCYWNNSIFRVIQNHYRANQNIKGAKKYALNHKTSKEIVFNYYVKTLNRQSYDPSVNDQKIKEFLKPIYVRMYQQNWGINEKRAHLEITNNPPPPPPPPPKNIKNEKKKGNKTSNKHKTFFDLPPF